ncbi:flagellar biosynthetic protein FliO [Paraburkholderia sp. DHOC27]|uniref:flagellar biosynthetic protein FliO n=1 Tax=Paraburkholderia sp. DHOC27 TaxID=2303330 RepID=UPI000E3D8577|nr:flagellar biosynthetic protein FliO [Paraburkholderia sp. DHOC27]RFU43685.1 flagellar biosynthetic protein FliO [Paraburkholderia sp. DHOC27]
MKRFAGRCARPERNEGDGLRSLFIQTRLAVIAALGGVSTLALTPLCVRAADLNAVNHAAQMASTVGAGTAVPALGVGAVLQTVFGLIAVIGLVFACAWLARRFGLQPGGSRGGLVKTIGGASLGGKERVTVVEIGDTWLVLGAAPGNVRLLHSMPAGSTGADSSSTGTLARDIHTGASTTLPGTFGQRFREALKGEVGKHVGKRFNRPDGGDQ